MDAEINAYLEAEDLERKAFLASFTGDGSIHHCAHRLWFDGLAKYGHAWIKREYELRIARRGVPQEEVT